MIRRLLVACAAVVGFASADPGARERQTVREVQAGTPLEGELRAGEVDRYRLTVGAGDFVHLVLDQGATDLAATLVGPDGKPAGEYDTYSDGLEPVSAIASQQGSYQLQVRSLLKAPSSTAYGIKFEVVRPAGADDGTRIAAQRISTEGKQLFERGTGESIKEAFKKFEEALPLWRRLDDRRGEANSLNALGLILAASGDNQKALDQLRRALSRLDATEHPRDKASALSNIGVVLSRMGDKRQALEHYAEALPLRRITKDYRGESSTLNNAGSVYMDIAEVDRALEHFSLALPLAQLIGDQRMEALTYNNLGTAHTLSGDVQKAIEYYGRAREMARKNSDTRGEVASLLNIGTVHSSFGQPEKALEALMVAAPLARLTGERRFEALTSLNTANVYRALGRTADALIRYDETLPLVRGMNDRRSEANVLLGVAETHRTNGGPDKALERYRLALPLFQSMGDRRGEAATLNGMGVVQASQGDVASALDSLEGARALAREIHDRSTEAQILANLAHIKRRQGDRAEAQRDIERALLTVEAIRTRVLSQDLRASFFASKRQYYEFYIDLLMESHEKDPAAALDATALAASERSRARSLLELLVEARADIGRGVDPALLARERALQRKIRAKAQRQLTLLATKQTASQAAVLTTELGALLTEHETLLGQIRAKSPHYAALVHPDPIALSEIRQLLDDNTLLLVYSLGDERSYLWAVSPAALASFRLPGRTEIEAAAARVSDLLKTHPTRTAASFEARLTRVTSELSRMILSPAAALLGRKRLLVVSEGALQHVPFAVLPAPDALGNPGASLPLVTRHEIVNLPSASALSIMRRERSGQPRAARTVAVIADPVFSPQDARVRRKQANQTASKSRSAEFDVNSPDGMEQLTRSAQESGVTLTGDRLPRLPFTRQEAQAILDLVPRTQSLKALDFMASRQTVVDPAIGTYQIVHFATHGLLNTVHPELSGIALSLVDENGIAQDGFLRLHDIYNLGLAADLVVLSACHSGLGKHIKGEGLIGLTRGFMHAGAASVVVSLWTVDDEATAELMRRFYVGMLGPSRLRPAAALRAAQLALIQEKRWRSPYYWAPFVLQGEWK